METGSQIDSPQTRQPTEGLEPPDLGLVRSLAKGKRACVVIPSRNEEATILSVLAGCRAAVAALGFSAVELVVTDDSTDGTRRLARTAGAHVVNGGGKGLGFAMYKGLKTAVAQKPDVIISMDSDGQSDPAEIGRFVLPVLADQADFVIGSRFLHPGLIGYDYPLVNRIGVLILAKILRILTGAPLTDSHGGLRAMTPEVPAELEMLGTHTYVQETIIDAAQKGFRIKEIPSVWKRRHSGGSRVVHSIPTYVFYTLPILLLRGGAHIRWLYTIGAGCMLAAGLYFLFIFYQADFRINRMFDRLPSFVLIALLVQVGLQLLLFGLLLQLLKDIKNRVDNLKAPET